MKNVRFVTYLVYCLLLLISCDKSDHDGPPLPPHPNGSVNAEIYGRVTDDNQTPVQGATVKAGNRSATTDLNGYFRLSNASLDKENGAIKVEKEGYFPGTRTFTPNAAATNYVTVQLIKKYLSGAFTAGSGGSVAVASGGAINFPANGIVRAGGNTAYTGQVSVYAYFINPQAGNFREIMPGALRGVANDSTVVGLKSYGMMAVELTGAGGEALQLAGGKTATITFPIPAKLQAGAPASIPLWHFNDTTGLWMQQGSAAKQGANYVGTVSHFSFWNCDDPFKIVDFAVTLKDQSGQPLRFSEVVLKVVGDTATTANGYTDSTGRVNGPVPLNKSMDMQVYNSCGVLLHKQTVGPYAADTDLGTITVTGSSSIQVTLTGTVVNCNGGAVNNGVVNILLDGKNNRARVSNGNFSIVIDRCQASAAAAQVYAIDLSTNERSYAKSINVTTGAANAGELDACGLPLDEFIQHSIFGTVYTLVPGDNMSAYKDDYIYIRGNKTPNQSDNVYITYNGTGTGTFPLISYQFYTTRMFTNNAPINVNITEYSSYIAGNFSGTVKDTANGAVGPLVVSFRVKKDF